MKKILAFIMCMLPLLVFTQTEDLVSIQQYMEKYSIVEDYKFVSINKKMLKQFGQIEGIDNTTKKLLSNCEFVQILEYKPKRVSVASTIVGVSSRNARSINMDRPRHGNIYYVDGVRVRNGPHLLSGRAKSKIDLSNFKQIGKIEHDGYNSLFRKKTFGSRKSEYLLLKGNKIISLKGKFDIENLEEFEDLENQLTGLLEFRESDE